MAARRRRLTRRVLCGTLGLVTAAGGGCMTGRACETLEISELRVEDDYTMVARVLRDGEPVQGRAVEFHIFANPPARTDENGYAVAQVRDLGRDRELFDQQERLRATVTRLSKSGEETISCNPVRRVIDLDRPRTGDGTPEP